MLFLSIPSVVAETKQDLVSSVKEIACGNGKSEFFLGWVVKEAEFSICSSSTSAWESSPILFHISYRPSVEKETDQRGKVLQEIPLSIKIPVQD